MPATHTRTLMRCARFAAATAGAAYANCAAPSLVTRDEHALAGELREKWAWEEKKAGNKPPNDTWPPVQPTAEEVPGLRRALEACGDARTPACHDVGFKLATGLLAIADKQQEGARLMRALADSGSADGACGVATCLLDGRGCAADEAAAAGYFAVAARAGLAQAQHELGCMHYRGDGGLEEDEAAAARCFVAAAEQGHAGAMYMLGDCLLDGVGTARDRDTALAWLVAAGELGHRGARSRVLALLLPTDDALVVSGRFTDGSRQTLAKLKRRATEIASRG